MTSSTTANQSTTTTQEQGKELQFQESIDSLLKLVTERPTGKSNDDQIEKAISSLLSTNCEQTVMMGNNGLLAPRMNNSSVSSYSSSNIINTNERSKLSPLQKGVNIVPDVENYDELEPMTRDVVVAKSGTEGIRAEELKWTGKKATIESLQEQNQEIRKQREASCNATPTQSQMFNNLDEIPLGRTGGRMMVTFGDGPHPNPNACAAILLATRQCLQNAVKDARALRRKMKDEVQCARTTAKLHCAKRKDRQILEREGEAVLVDPELLYRAIGEGIRRSTPSELKCGFDVLHLKTLFPEEMYAYQRWKKMHKDFSDSKEGKDKKPKKDQVGQDTIEQHESGNDSENEVAINNETKSGWGGHLQNRLAQFDARTKIMKEQWYMAFSEVRQGSFLPRLKTKEDREWKRNGGGKKKLGRGRKRIGFWEDLPPQHVQFLHWIGFDPRSSLPPPCAQTAEALAFLGYDFMGKIVEKAIFLRCLKKLQKEEMERCRVEKRMLLQLEADEQLTEEDVCNALKDSTVMAKPLYNACNSVLAKGEAVQLYFGPGFEERIELELEQIVMPKKKATQFTEKEKEIRAEEDELFDKIKSPPILLNGVMDVLGDEHKTDEMMKQRVLDKKRQREKDEKRSAAFERTIMNLNHEENAKKLRWKPKAQIPLESNS